MDVAGVRKEHRTMTLSDENFFCHDLPTLPQPDVRLARRSTVFLEIRVHEQRIPAAATESVQQRAVARLRYAQCRLPVELQQKAPLHRRDRRLVRSEYARLQ